MRHRRSHLQRKLRRLRPKRHFFQLPLFWLALVAVVGIGAVGYLALLFPKFQVQEVAVIGNQKIAGSDIQAIAWQSIHQKIAGMTVASIFTVNSGAITDRLHQAFPAMKSVSVKRNWLTGLVLEVAERQPVAVFCFGRTGDGCYLLDDSGVIFEPAAEAEGKFIVRQSGQALDPILGQRAVDAKTMDLIIRVHDDLEKNFQISIKEVFSSNPLIFSTTEGWKLYFDPGLDAATQIAKMDSLLRDEITPEARAKLQYIYLQYKDRAYYK